MHGARLYKTFLRDAMARHPRRDLLGRDRNILLRDRDETETLRILSETRPKRDVNASRDRLETETSRPRPYSWVIGRLPVGPYGCSQYSLPRKGHGGTGATDDLTRNKYGIADPPVGQLYLKPSEYVAWLSRNYQSASTQHCLPAGTSNLPPIFSANFWCSLLLLLNLLKTLTLSQILNLTLTLTLILTPTLILTLILILSRKHNPTILVTQILVIGAYTCCIN